MNFAGTLPQANGLGNTTPQVVTIINNYKKEHGDPPEVMARLYEILHERNMKNMATVKGMLSLYK